MQAEKLARLRLAAALPYRPLACRALVERFGTAAEAAARPASDWAEVLGLRVEETELFHQEGRRFDAARELAEVEKLGVRLLWPGLAGYPEELTAIPDPPALLWVLGELAPVRGLAIVGTRGPSPYGKKTAAKLAEGAVRAGMAVVSGLARGIDTAAHKAAVDAGGATWAVLGSGLARIYPAENAPLARRIVETGGALLSEHALHVEPLPENFPRRNRVVSGLSFGTVVVEGALKSGALITAKCALEQGRDVFAVPGPVDWELARGPHRLIRDGAKLIEGIDDVLQELDLFHAAPSPAPADERKGGEPVLNGPHGRVLTALGPTARTFEELATTVGWEAARLSEALTEMELLGLVGGLPGRRVLSKMTPKKTTDKAPKTKKAPAVKAEKAMKPEKAAKAEKPAKAKKAAKSAGDGTSLVVVESPAKERTISKFLGKGYVVKSSYGHVRDLPEKKMGVDEENDFEPTYVVLPRAKKILPELTKACEKASQVFLATDHDREGESIAWHLVELLKLDASKVRRITFTEITPGAIKDAINAPRAIDGNLVSAQQARRILDRLVGYKLSPLLWQKVRRGLSAGRVQSAAVRLLAERHKEIQAFLSETYWTLTIGAEKEGAPKFPARLIQWKGEKIERTQTFQLFAEEYKIKLTSFRTRESLDDVLAQLSENKVKVTRVEARTVSRRPSPPFATSTLQQEASRELGYSSDRTMRIAQQLYEGVHLGEKEDVGLITYMRTDSFNVSKTAQEEARRFLQESYGDAYLPAESPTYATKSRGAQEAHEAIRPTSVYRRPDDIKDFLTPEQYRVYHLVWRRFLASQMTEAQFDTVSADLEKGEALFRATGRTLKFDGFLKLYREEDEENENVLPPLAEGDVLPVVELLPEEHQSSPPPNYNEASLIRALEKHGIGRPSTYAPIVKTIVERGYAQRGLKDKKLTATELGLTVTDKLKEHFPEVVSLEYTSEVEEKLDAIAEGTSDWHEVLRKFYGPFRKALDKAYKEMPKIEPKQTEEKCPKCGEKMLLRESRFGKYLSCPRFPKCRGKIPLNPEGQKIQPQQTDEKCPECGKPMLIRFGRRGRFMACTGYPACKVTFSVDAEGKKVAASRPIPTERPCNKCSSPLWLRSGKRGYFLACSAYPKCRNIVSIAQDEAEEIAASKGVPVVAPAAPAAASEAPKEAASDGGTPTE